MLRRRRAVAHALAVIAAVVLAAAGARAYAPERAGAGPLPFFYDLYTFRGPADSTLVLAAFAVPAAALAREHVERQVRYRFDVTLVLADSATGTVFRTDDSVYVRFSRPPTRDHLLSTHVQVRAPPSAGTRQYVILTDATTPGVGQLFSSEFTVPDYSGSRLMVSDLALSLPGAVHGWKHGDATLALLPTADFPRSAFDVYYEIYNLPPGHRYSTEIAVQRLADDRGRPVTEESPVRVRYSGRSAADPDGTLPEQRFVDAAVEEGGYRIIVTITDAETGEAASRTRRFQVSGWAPGSTLVTALPRRGEPER